MGYRAGDAAKRALDTIVAGVALIVLAPLLAILAVAIRVSLGRPVFFLQERPGFEGRPFIMYKLRTMTDRRDVQGNLLSDAERLTALGTWMRRFSLDELPELFNVIKGDMSLVGPRPLLMRYLPRYTPEQARRHEVRPGITGWAQVNGRNAITWGEKLALDVWYVDHRSLGLDLRILWRTAWQLVRREGINQPGHATVEEFMGETRP